MYKYVIYKSVYKFSHFECDQSYKYKLNKN